MRNRVLISSVGRKVALVRAFKEAGWDITGNDADQCATALRECDRFGSWYGDIDLWVPTRDMEIIEAWNFNDWDYSPVELCTDKFKFYNWCKERGFKTAEVYFVKPRVSKSGKEVECVWQELLEGDEYSVDLFADFRSQVISVVPRLRLKTSAGESTVTQTVKNDALLQESIALSSALGLVGHNCLQGFWKNGQMIWTDVNCRFGGASIVAIKAGCKSPEWLLRLVNGESVRPVIGDYEVGLVGKSHSEWTFGGS